MCACLWVYAVCACLWRSNGSVVFPGAEMISNSESFDVGSRRATQAFWEQKIFLSHWTISLFPLCLRLYWCQHEWKTDLYRIFHAIHFYSGHWWKLYFTGCTKCHAQWIFIVPLSRKHSKLAHSMGIDVGYFRLSTCWLYRLQSLFLLVLNEWDSISTDWHHKKVAMSNCWRQTYKEVKTQKRIMRRVVLKWTFVPSFSSINKTTLIS